MQITDIFVMLYEALPCPAVLELCSGCSHAVLLVAIQRPWLPVREGRVLCTRLQSGLKKKQNKTHLILGAIESWYVQKQHLYQIDLCGFQSGLKKKRFETYLISVFMQGS